MATTNELLDAVKEKNVIQFKRTLTTILDEKKEEATKKLEAKIKKEVSNYDIALDTNDDKTE